MRTLSFIFCLILSALVFSLSAADTYTVNTKSKLNLRSGPGTSYSVVTQMPPGSTVTMVEDNGNRWVKVESNGKQGYVMKRYLKIASQDAGNGERQRYKISEDPHNKWLLWTIVGLLILVFLNNCTEFLENKFLISLLYLALPAAIILYTKITQDATWFCDPDIVGWGYTILNVILLLVVVIMCGGFCFEAFTDLFVDFSFMLLLIGLAFGAATFFMVIAALKELIIVAVIMMMGAGSGATYVGTLITANGDVFDIFKR